MTDTPEEALRRRRTLARERAGRGADGAGNLARARADILLDAGSFAEIGSLAASGPREGWETMAGDGKLSGFGTVDGRPVGIVVDDATVKGASSTAVTIRKIDRIYAQALRAGHPVVYLGETRGSRIPDTLGSEGMPEIAGEGVLWARRCREIPLATVITGPSFGGSSFIAAMSDLVVQVKGSCFAVVSPRVIEVATGEQIGFEELGGTEVHARVTGQIDLVAEDDAEALDMVRRWLSYLPDSVHSPMPLAEPKPPLAKKPLHELVPSERKRGYNVRRVVQALVDGGEMLELKPDFGRPLLTALARLDGVPVGVLASNPTYQGGALDPDSCDKGSRFLTLCDSFGLPVVILQDSPGFLVGSKVEHGRAINKSVMFLEALALMSVPRLVVILRKSYGLSYTSLGGFGTDSDLFVAWPGAEIGFMDPEVGANILYGGELEGLEPEEGKRRLSEMGAELAQANDPWGSAARMSLDEIIEPAETRDVLVSHLRRFARRPNPATTSGRLRNWPTAW